MSLFSIKASIFLILALFFSGCATHDAKGRLYDLQDGSVINVKLNNYSYGHGTATAVLQTGEQLKGEFTLSQLTGTHKNKTHTLISPFQGEISVSGSASKSIPQKETPGFSQVYGFSEKFGGDPCRHRDTRGQPGHHITNGTLFFRYRPPYWRRRSPLQQRGVVSCPYRSQQRTIQIKEK